MAARRTRLADLPIAADGAESHATAAEGGPPAAAEEDQDINPDEEAVLRRF